MQTQTIELIDAQKQFQDVVRSVMSGLHVILSQNHKPVAHILPAGRRVSGLHAGSITTSEDFDAPLSEEYWLEGK